MARSIDPADPEVREAYNDADTLAEFGEWCAARLFGGTPEHLGDLETVRWTLVLEVPADLSPSDVTERIEEERGARVVEFHGEDLVS